MDPSVTLSLQKLAPLEEVLLSAGGAASLGSGVTDGIRILRKQL